MNPLFQIRNRLNFVFIVLAIVAIIGVLRNGPGDGRKVYFYIAAIAVIIKIMEVVLRIPTMINKTEYEQRRYNKTRYSGLSETESAQQ